jgi:hypothetical protein
MFDGTALGQEIVTQTRAHIERSIEPLARRIAELEAQPDVAAVVADAMRAIPVPKDGRDGEPGKDGEPGLPGKDGEPGLPGKDGLDAGQTVVPDDTAELVARTVKLLAEMPSAVMINSEEMLRRSQPTQPPVHVHLPAIDIPQIVMPDSIEMKAPVVNVHVPEQRKHNTETTVVSHDSKGRIKKFVQKEI